MPIYFDNAATSKLAPEIEQSITIANRDLWANPNSIHSLGKEVRKHISAARELCAKSIGAESEEIFFTSGATESNNTIFHIADYDLIITSPSEHPSVLETSKASKKEIIWLNLDQTGLIDLNELEANLSANTSKKILVSIMHVNNETGTTQDIHAIGQLCKQYGAQFHSDCVQSWLKLDINVKDMRLDYVSVSAHKMHGPKGIGFLYKSKHAQCRHQALLVGGGQESGLRSGTQNVTGILAMGKQVEIHTDNDQLLRLDNYARAELKKHGAIINGSNHAPGIINVAFLDLPFNSEQLVLQLDLAGFCVSSGSACSSLKGEAGIISSYVLRSYQLDSQICDKSIRISLSRFNSKEEIDKLIEKISEF